MRILTAFHHKPTPPPKATARTPPPSPATRDRCALPAADSVNNSLDASNTAITDPALDAAIPEPKSKEYMESLRPPTPRDFERIAHIQQEKEEESRRKAREEKRRLLQERREQEPPSPPGGRARAQAARLIQRTFRGYRARRELKGFGLDPGTRWLTAVREAQFRQSTLPRPRSKAGEEPAAEGGANGRPVSAARQNWKKASLIARRAGHDDLTSSSSESDSLSSSDEEALPAKRAERRRKRDEATTRRKHEARMMGLQYFLEMVDLKHRYGSNLRTYHEAWKKSDTSENFFYWLDYGEGRNVHIDACPRDRLERERVRYLSREERQYYLARVDSEGKLVWAKTGAYIDTTVAYKDSIHGIVPADDPTPAFTPALDTDTASAHSSSSLSSLESRREADRAAKYANPEADEGKAVQKVSHMSASVIFDKLLRKSVRKNTWIFVADTSFRLFVGIKDSGAFQHSSFLQGSRISAAGLIKIKNGRLRSLSPLSGHYRPPAANFRAFVTSLRETGVDMKRVSISKSYSVLVGLEAYVKTRRKGKEALNKMLHKKEKIVAPEQVKRRVEDEMDKSASAKREREVLEEEALKRERNRASVKMMQTLYLRPRVPRGQKGPDGGHEPVEGVVQAS